MLEEAYRSEQHRLLRYLRRRVGDTDAPDLLQEVFVRAAGSQQAAWLANPAGFLRRIARNLLIDQSRRQKANPVRTFPLDDHHHLSTPADQTLQIEAKDLLRCYERAMATLPEKTRRVFLLHRVEELSYRQIHQRLGISVATVEYHMMKALAHVAEVVDAHR